MSEHVPEFELDLQLMSTLSMINAQIGELEIVATGMKIHASRVRDMTGSFMMTPLLVSRAQVLHSLAMLKQPQESLPQNVIHIHGTMTKDVADKIKDLFRKTEQ